MFYYGVYEYVQQGSNRNPNNWFGWQSSVIYDNNYYKNDIAYFKTYWSISISSNAIYYLYIIIENAIQFGSFERFQNTKQTTKEWKRPFLFYLFKFPYDGSFFQVLVFTRVHKFRISPSWSILIIYDPPVYNIIEQ